jgi:hypothetical protein
MIKYLFKFPEKTIECNIPQSWNELTVKQALALNLKTFKGDPLTGIERLCEVQEGTLRNTEMKPVYKKAIKSIMEFLDSVPNDLHLRKHEQPEIVIKGKTIKIPSDLQKESFGQYVTFQQFAESERALPLIMALYMQPLLDGDYGESERIEELSYEIEKMMFLEVFPIVNFFFQKLRGYKIYGMSESKIFH